ncbi:MAG: phosphatidate cytidylyltransferase, partial [Dehalococcoidia bacterium]|nr:phosphatidate cytidylyltransferase [Dehalococcoidia bacterium]
MFKQRTITTFIGIPITIAVVWFGEPYFSIMAVIWGGGSVYEFYRIVGTAKLPPLTWFGLAWTLLFIVSPHFSKFLPTDILLTTAVIFPLVWLLGVRRKEDAFARWAWTVAGILYIGWLLSYLVLLRGMDGGRNWAFMALFGTFGSDISAYLVGRAIGRHRLAPNISPAKTWEGAVAGVIGAVLVCIIIVTVLNTSIGYRQAILVGVVISVVGQLG